MINLNRTFENYEFTKIGNCRPVMSKKSFKFWKVDYSDNNNSFEMPFQLNHETLKTNEWLNVKGYSTLKSKQFAEWSV